jgi:hypothetical protein
MIPAFRDFLIPTYFYNLDKVDFGILKLEMLLFNFLTSINIKNEISVWIYLGLWLIIGFYLTFQVFYKRISLLKALVITGFYFCNYWTVERYLMGHINLLKGHFIFIPIVENIYQSIFASNSISNTLITKKNIAGKIEVCFKVALLVSFLSFISIHHLAFLAFFVSLIFLYHFFHSQHYKQGFLQGQKYILQTLLIIILIFSPSFLIQTVVMKNNIAITEQINTVFKQKDEIISSFSLKVNSDQNIVTRAIIGSGSWNTPSFQEISKIKESSSIENNILINLLPYFNKYLEIFLCFFIIITVVAGLISRTSIKYLSLLALLLLVLNFGYSVEVIKPISSFFYNLSFWNFSPWLIFRESGKFYGFFLSIFCILLADYDFYYKNKHSNNFLNKVNWLKYGIITILVSSNIIFSIAVLANQNLITLPSFDKQISNYCSTNKERLKQGLFLPNTIYIQTSYSQDIFIPNHYYYSSKCLFKKPLQSFVSNNKWSAISLFENNTIADTLLPNVDDACDNTSWINRYREEKIDFIALDVTYYQDLRIFVNCVIKNTPPTVAEKNLYFWDLTN